MKIKIICVGKLSLKWRKVFGDYLKKVGFFAKIDIIEVKEFNHKNNFEQKKLETKEVLKHLKNNEQTILCSLKGKMLTSKEFSEYFNQDLTFIIGGSHGLEEEKFKQKLTFSKLTFPHQLFRIILIEQIFRALSIKNNTNYHK